MDIKPEKIKEEPQCDDFAEPIANIKYEKDYELFTDDVKTERDVDIENQINKILGTTVKEELDDEMLETDIFKEIPEVKDEPSSDDEAEHSLPGIKSEEVMLKSESEADNSERGDHRNGYIIDKAETKGHGYLVHIYSCKHCHYKSHRRDLLSRHRNAQHCENSRKKYHCHVCDFRTYRKDFLTNHVLIKHDTNFIKRFVCHICDFRSHYKSGLKNHILGQHNDGDLKMFSCLHCDFRTHRSDRLRTHIMSKHDKVVLKKLSCNYDLNIHREDGLRKHIRAKYAENFIKKYYCDNCNYNSQEKIFCKLHRATHNGDLIKRFVCHLCNYRATHKHYLSNHIRAIHYKSNEGSPTIFHPIQLF